MQPLASPPLLPLLLLLLAAALLAAAELTESDCVAFLRRHMPPSDRATLTDSFLRVNARQALRARAAHPWGPAIPDAVFLNDVLPYASLTEPRDPWRNLNSNFNHKFNYKFNSNFNKNFNFTAFMRDAVRGCEGVRCAAAALNARAWALSTPPIVFEAAPPNAINSYSPFETLRRHNSSCTGLSIFLVDALRAVTVPARVAGTPHWALGPETCPNGDADPPCGNHNWVEVFVPGSGWSFIDQRRPDGAVLPLNTSWFYPSHTAGATSAAENHTIFAASFVPPAALLEGGGYWGGEGVVPARHFPLAWDWGDTSVPAWDVTAAYAGGGAAVHGGVESGAGSGGSVAAVE